jgi:hypothetical protein
MESREAFWDYEVELPSKMWQIGSRTLKMRTRAEVRGSEGDRGFIVRNVVKVLGHEVEPDGWEGGTVTVFDA